MPAAGPVPVYVRVGGRGWERKAAHRRRLRAGRGELGTTTPGGAERRALAPLLNMFFQQAVAELSKSLPDENEPHEVLFLIDEFPMLGAMPTLQKGLALLAGYKIRIVLITQGIGQLDEIYGRQATEGILQNCALQVFFASNDDKTTNYVSARLGSKTVQVRSRSQSQDWTSATTSTSYIARPLLPPEEVRRLDPRKAIIFKETSRPVLAEKVRYYADKRFAPRVTAPPPVPALKIEPPLDRGELAVAALAKLVDLDPPSEPPAPGGRGAADFEAVYDGFREEMQE